MQVGMAFGSPSREGPEEEATGRTGVVDPIARFETPAQAYQGRGNAALLHASRRYQITCASLSKYSVVTDYGDQSAVPW